MSLAEKTELEDIGQKSLDEVALEFRKLVFTSQRDDAKALEYFNCLTSEQKQYIKYTKPYDSAFLALHFKG